eukprot:95107_1
MSTIDSNEYPMKPQSEELFMEFKENDANTDYKEYDTLKRELDHVIREKKDAMNEVKLLIKQLKQRGQEIKNRNVLQLTKLRDIFTTKIKDAENENGKLTKDLTKLRERLKDIHDKLDKKYTSDCAILENKYNEDMDSLKINKLESIIFTEISNNDDDDSNIIDDKGVKTLDNQIHELMDQYKKTYK